MDDGRLISRRTLLGGVLGAGLVAAGTAGTAVARTPMPAPPLADVHAVDPHAVIDRFTGVRPSTWGTDLPGILHRTPVRTVPSAGSSAWPTPRSRRSRSACTCRCRRRSCPRTRCATRWRARSGRSST